MTPIDAYETEYEGHIARAVEIEARRLLLPWPLRVLAWIGFIFWSTRRERWEID